MDLQNKIQHLFSSQREEWKLLDDNCKQMHNIEVKSLRWGSDVEVILQYNPSRLISASAKVDEKSIKGIIIITITKEITIIMKKIRQL